MMRIDIIDFPNQIIHKKEINDLAFPLKFISSKNKKENSTHSASHRHKNDFKRSFVIFFDLLSVFFGQKKLTEIEISGSMVLSPVLLYLTFNSDGS